MSLVQISGEDIWLKEFESIGVLVSEINQATVRRRQLQLGNLEYATISSELRKHILQAELQLATLQKHLEPSRTTASQSIAPGERERRKRLLENVQSALKKAADEFHRGLPRQQGPFTRVADLGVADWGADDEASHTMHLSNAELRQGQRSTLQAQEAVLGSLSEVVGSQRRIAKAIQSEVEDQDELLIDIKERVGDNQTNLEQETATAQQATRKVSTWGLWLVIFLLLLAIIIVAVW